MIAHAGADHAPTRSTSPSSSARRPTTCACTTTRVHAAAHAFLLDAGDEMDPREIAAPGAPLAELARARRRAAARRARGARRPSRSLVVRALVPGLIPISFGYDREPLGLPRLAAPVRTHDGRTLGNRVDLTLAGPILPHPFP